MQGLKLQMQDLQLQRAMPKKKVEKSKNVEYYLALAIKRANNKATVVRSHHPSLTLYVNAEELHRKLITNVCDEYFREIANLHIIDLEKEDETLTYMTFQPRESEFEYELNISFKISKLIITDEVKVRKSIQTKLAKVFEHQRFHLLPHQQQMYDIWWQTMGKDVFENDFKDDSYLLFWKMGYGKSQAALYPWSKFYVKKVFILCDNTMIETWIKFIETLPQIQNTETTFKVLGLTEFARKINNNGDYLANEIVIFDEAHKYRNLTESMHNQIEALQKAKFVFNLTGTPIVNARNNLIGLGKLMRYKFQPFEIELLNSSETDDFTSKQILKLVENIFNSKIHFCAPAIADERFAPVKIELKHIEMTWSQTIDYLICKRQVFKIGDLQLQTSQRNSYHVNEKRISNSSLHSDTSPKFTAIVNDTLEVKGHGQIIYSNFLENGILPIFRELKKKGASVALATGDTSEFDRDTAFNAYNDQKVDILCLSSIGGIGLTFKNTKILRLVDSFENLPSENQCIGRVSRIGAHTKKKKTDILPTVLVIKYISIFPRMATDKDNEECLKYFKQYYYKSPWYTLEESLNTDKRFIDLLQEKIEKEEHKQTIDEKLQHSNAVKHSTIEPVISHMALIGTFTI